MSELPEITGLAEIDPDDWRSFGQHLSAIGVSADGVAPVLALSNRLAEDDRDPIRLWHLRGRGDAAALAMRLLMFGDALTQSEAISALGEDHYRRLLAAGLLRSQDGAVRCVLRLGMAGDCLVFADDLALGGDAVMGVRETTTPLWRAVAPPHRVRNALDLGCGAGTIALLLSHHVDQVVATDINPRAVAMARINVAINGLHNIDVREGDMYAPVGDQVFDVIAAHAPYVALPEGSAAMSHMHGGPRGDEVVSRMVSGAASHLAPGGLAIVQAHWPLREGQGQTEHIRELAAAELDLLVLRMGATNADDLALFWGLREERSAASVARVREHYARLGLVGTEASIAVLRRSDGTPSWTAMLEVPPESMALVTAQRIATLLRCCDLLHGPDAALLAARLRVPDGTSLATIEGLRGAAATRTMLMLPPATLRKAVETTVAAQQIISAIHRAPTVAESGQPLGAVREALARGALEPVQD
jgi:methylase of polypeptide subunit release factors